MSRFKPGQSGNPAGRPKGAANKRTQILEAIQAEFGTEQEFWAHVARKAKDGDNECTRILANRLAPPLKSVAPLFTADIGFESLEQGLESIIGEVAAGNIPSDQARDLIAAAKDVAAVTKLVEFDERLAALEEKRARLATV